MSAEPYHLLLPGKTLLNPYALAEMPCSDCGKAAAAIGPLEGRVIIRLIDNDGAQIAGRQCGPCFGQELAGSRIVAA